ncbi:HAD-superfamily subfamily IB hydrolase, TIGR01490 [Vibrio gazogenes DSM 21264]|uniref:HAD-superfamily subfamily IB hydrolase, TIGR01490 n=1 Tax=Vibrio gazogenes DSM 21264 = NBRC 103151 TaxID=1123492 RepID=A0A1M5EM50_VIBGA|nr:HAD family hydrolase [Vibrio gazogenes]USP12564.1 HAD-IB family hydrolase [Vibrio gazogenes]SHF80277.1 HAD-superfamily subfamily IB hydrolase, TIGR01490 [Vibrio gazogenes DSM 21264] [Vibrio gazogenes DSM 21264 = NBRC 103151]SJN54061.1 haloacid dehalogenase-like hydrolase [Vibrio gazogenes]
MSNPLYVFDMDDTLIDGDCAMIWNAFLVEKGIVTDPEFLAKDHAMMDLYAAGEMDMATYLDFTLAPLTKLPQATVDALVEECITTRVLPRQFREAQQLIGQLTAQHRPMLIISATVSFIVRQVAQKIGIPDAIGIDLVVENQCYTSQIDGIPSYREGKIRRLNDWIAAQPQSFSAIHFYTDSINDLPLCQQADYVYLINPAPVLSQQAEGKPHWHIYHWEKTESNVEKKTGSKNIVSGKMMLE